MPENFDPYYKWLGISPKHQPPHHYRLLGVEAFESDIEVIEAAAKQRLTYVAGLAAGEHTDLSVRILQEIAAARSCLTNPAKKAAYDAKLLARLKAAQAKAQAGGELDSDQLLAEAARASRAAAEPRAAQPPPARGPKSGAEREREADAPPPPPAIAPPAAPPVAGLPVATPVAVARPVAVSPVDPMAPILVSGGPGPAASAVSAGAPLVRVAKDIPARPAKRNKRPPTNPLLWTIGSAVAVLSLLAVILFTVGGGDHDRGRGQQLAQADGAGKTPTSSAPVVTSPAGSGSAGSGPATPSPHDTAGPLGENSPPAKPAAGAKKSPGTTPAKPPSFQERPLAGGDLVARVMIAMGNREVSEAEALLHEILQTGGSEDRTFARGLLDEITLAGSDAQAQRALGMLSEEELGLLASNAESLDLGDVFHYPVLQDRFREALRRNLPAERRRRAQGGAPRPPGSQETPPQQPAGEMVAGNDNPPGEAERVEDPEGVLRQRGLVRREGFWLDQDDDELRSAAQAIAPLENRCGNLATSLAERAEAYRGGHRELQQAEQQRAPNLEAVRREFNRTKETFHEFLLEYGRARNALTLQLLPALEKQRELARHYEALREDPQVRAALVQLGESENKLGPSPAFQRNQGNLQKLAEALLARQAVGFWVSEAEQAFCLDLIVNDRTSAKFVLKPGGTINWISERLARAAGIAFDAEERAEIEINGARLRAPRVIIPSVRIGQGVSTGIEAYIVPAEGSRPENLLTDNAFPNLRLEGDFGDYILRATPGRQPE
jgi:hypothetical protein